MKHNFSTPSASFLVDDLLGQGHSIRDIAKYLAVTEKTLRRYARTNKAPRAVLKSLFWISTYGVSYLCNDTHNGMVYATGLANSLKRENQALRDAIGLLEAEIQAMRAERGDASIAANESFFILGKPRPVMTKNHPVAKISNVFLIKTPLHVR
jgi:hypothetical protein